MILCTLLMAACGGKKAQGESVNADSDSIAERQQYRFECQFIKAENKEYVEWTRIQLLNSNIL